MDTISNGSHKQTLADKYDISLEKLDPKYIAKCVNVKELEKILKILRSGEEGHYPHLESQCEDKILQLAPKSRILRKETPLISTKDLPDKDNIVDDIKSWTAEMKTKDSAFLYSNTGGDENIPPVRSGTTLTGKTKTINNTGQAKGNKKAMPKDYKEWDKIISNLDDAEEEEQDKVKDKSEPLEPKKPSKSLTSQVSTQGLSDEEKVTLANREKDKGNEAFRSGDFMEAIVYYNRSLSVLPITATYNNRALAYIRVSKWSDAVSDCNRVLRDEPENIKATLRRACAYKSLRKFRLAKDDLDTVLEVEPQNKRARDILKDVSKELARQEELKAKGKGNRMIIEETDGESDEEVEEIIIEPTKETMTSAPSADSVVSQPVPTPPQTGDDKVSPAPQPRRIVIEEDSDDNSSDEGQKSVSESTSSPASSTAERERTSSPASSNAEHSSNSLDSSENTSPRDDVTKTKKSVSRNSSLLSIIQQNIATTSNGQSESQPGSDSESASSSPRTSTTGATFGEVILSVASKDQIYSTNTPVVDNNAPVVDATTPVIDTNTPVVDNIAHKEVASGKIELTTFTGSESQNTEDKASASAGTAVSEVIKVPALPAAVELLKAKGNDLFKSGQYGEAISYYTQAIDKLNADHSRAHHRATLYSNRSACCIKTGDCRAAVKDCTTALELTPHNAKALLRRATANEMLERYMEAYVDYRHVINLDSGAATAYAGASRCERMLSTENMKWRATVPKIPSCSNLPRYEIEAAVSITKPVSAPSHIAATPRSKTVLESDPQKTSPVSSPPRTETVVESNEDKFNRLKEKGNKMVAKSDYEQANAYYTRAIDLYPDRVAPYSNRALCHLKSNNPGLAVKDCDTVLAIEPTHIKALFRRAQANKMVEKYKESLTDLMSLLKLDPQNAPAKKEVEVIKVAYRAQLQSLQKSTSSNSKQSTSKQSVPQMNREKAAKPANQEPSKAPTRIVIEEGSDSEPEKAPTAPAASAATGQSKNKSRQKKKKQAKKSAAARANQSQQSATTASSVPTLSADPSAYEFTQAWTALRHTKDTEPYARLLKQIPPNKLTEVLSNKLEAEMLEKIISCLDNHFGKDELSNVENYLKSLARVPRFSMITMFMSVNCKSALESILGKLKPVSSHVDNIRVLYGI